jgi:hypothetical protein
MELVLPQAAANLAVIEATAAESGGERDFSAVAGHLAGTASKGGATG